MKSLLDWLDQRTGFRVLVHAALYEHIPGGARWRYVWGSTLVFTFSVQVITGIFLWMAYSPSTQTAWESVYYIQHQMQGGWLLRGVHHFTAQAMVILLVLHLLQVVIDGAYRAPREFNFWIGLILMQIVLGLSLTGYLLPWDQKGYWATRVATNLIGLVPALGEPLQKIVVGGSDYGHHTLTRFFALHAGLLPGLLVLFLVLHVALFRRHGISHKEPVRAPDSTFWPDQVLKDAVACLAVLAAILFFVVWHGINSDYSFDARHAGAELGAPADGSETYSAARPEWYFLFLFQLLKYFPGKSEIVGAIILPGAVMLLLFLMPLVGRWRAGHFFNIALVLLLIFGGIAPLTYLAWREDHRGDDGEKYLAAVEEAEADAQRIVELAQSESGIPPTGAITLLRNDAKTQGRKLFARKCGICHTFFDPAVEETPAIAEQLKHATAGNLHDFASREWVAGLLDPNKIASSHYFGKTKHREGEMVEFVTDALKEWPPEDVANAVIALSAQAELKSQARLDERDRDKIAAGVKLIENTDNCAQCHAFNKANDSPSAPDLTGYGSRQWLIDFIGNPADERFYGERNDRMPAFRDQLSPREIGFIVDWLRHEWYEPPAGESTTGEPTMRNSATGESR